MLIITLKADKKLWEAIGRKCIGMLTQGVGLTFCITMQLSILHRKDFKTSGGQGGKLSSTLPYRSDLAPCDCHLLES